MKNLEKIITGKQLNWFKMFFNLRTHFFNLVFDHVLGLKKTSNWRNLD